MVLSSGRGPSGQEQGWQALLSLPAGARVVAPRPLASREDDWLAAVTTEGRLLVFPVRDLPQLGKGNKIIGIPGERVASREEYLVDLAVLPAGATLVLQAGKRTLSLKAEDLEHYKGERARQQAAARLPARRGPAGRSVTMCIGAGIDGQIHGR